MQVLPTTQPLAALQAWAFSKETQAMVCSHILEKIIDPAGNNSLPNHVTKVLDGTTESHCLYLNFPGFPPLQGLVQSFYFSHKLSVDQTGSAWPAQPGCTPTVWSSQMAFPKAPALEILRIRKQYGFLPSTSLVVLMEKTWKCKAFKISKSKYIYLGKKGKESMPFQWISQHLARPGSGHELLAPAVGCQRSAALQTALQAEMHSCKEHFHVFHAEILLGVHPSCSSPAQALFLLPLAPCTLRRRYTDPISSWTPQLSAHIQPKPPQTSMLPKISSMLSSLQSYVAAMAPSKPELKPASFQAVNFLHVYPLEGLFWGFID